MDSLWNTYVTWSEHIVKWTVGISTHNHSSIIWPVWLNGCVFVYELSGWGIYSSCSYLNFRFGACFEQEVAWNSGNYRVWIYYETRMWHDKNIHSIRFLLKKLPPPNFWNFNKALNKTIPFLQDRKSVSTSQNEELLKIYFTKDLFLQPGISSKRKKLFFTSQKNIF